MDLEYRIAKLELRPDDIVVLKMGKVRPTETQVIRLKGDLERILGHGIRVIVLDVDMELSILTREEIEQMAQPSGKGL